MNRDRVVAKVLTNLKMAGFIDPFNSPFIRPFLEQVWAAGWEEGRLEINQHTNKKIAQYDQHGRLIAIYKSRVEAAKLTGFKVDTIKKSMERGAPMKQGYTWIYIEDTPIYKGPF